MSCQKSSNRLFLLLIPCLMFLLVSCQSGPAEPEGQCTVTFSVSNYRQVSFDDLSSSGMSRAEKIYMTLANLSLTVFDAETNKQVISTIHKSDDYYDENDISEIPHHIKKSVCFKKVQNLWSDLLDTEG